MDTESVGDERHPRQGVHLRLRFPNATCAAPSAPRSVPAAKGVHLRLRFPNATPQPCLEPFNRLPTAVNYFLGNDPTHRHTNVPVYPGVRYVNLYPGVDLKWRSEGGRLTPRLVCRTVCSPSAPAQV